MTMPGLDTFGLTMRGLEAGLRVHHIAAFDLKTCSVADSVKGVLSDSVFADFDQIPVKNRTHRIVGVLLRAKNTDTGKVREYMQPLDESLLVSGEAPLMSFVKQAGTAPYKLVLNEHGIKGIVTRSDLLKLPVRLLAFACITHLETLMAEVVRSKYSNRRDEWIGLLKTYRQRKVREKERSLKRARLDIDPLELTDFQDKRRLTKVIADLDHEFMSETGEAEKLRNQIAHAASFVTSEEEARQFAIRLQKIEGWIARLQQLAQQRAQT
jgi:hypothetical protein